MIRSCGKNEIRVLKTCVKVNRCIVTTSADKSGMYRSTFCCKRCVDPDKTCLLALGFHIDKAAAPTISCRQELGYFM